MFPSTLGIGQDLVCTKQKLWQSYQPKKTNLNDLENFTIEFFYKCEVVITINKTSTSNNHSAHMNRVLCMNTLLFPLQKLNGT